MASRFDIATGKIPENRAKPKPAKTRIPARAPRVQTFVSRLKLVNSISSQEINLDNAGFNLSVEADTTQIQATVSISFTCPVDVAQRLLS